MFSNCFLIENMLQSACSFLYILLLRTRPSVFVVYISFERLLSFRTAIFMIASSKNLLGFSFFYLMMSNQLHYLCFNFVLVLLILFLKCVVCIFYFYYRFSCNSFSSVSWYDISLFFFMSSLFVGTLYIVLNNWW